MGCGCKEKPKSPMSPKVIQVASNEATIVSKPLYTDEDVYRLENWLTSTNKTPEETEYVFEFNRQHFGEVMQGYCDIDCQHRIRRRVEHMKEKLLQWKKDQ